MPRVIFDGNAIAYSLTVKNLGIIFDRTLSWGPQLQVTCQKLYGSAFSLRRLRYFLPTATKIAIAQSLLLPVLDYADVCYLDLTEVQLDKLERLQNFCIRFIFGLKKFDHVSPFRTKLKWLPIRRRRDMHVLSLLYTILFHSSTPGYLKDRFEFLFSLNNRNLRSSENLLLKFPSHNQSFYGNSFSVHAVRLWNALPLEIKQASSLFSFKNKVKLFYLAAVATG